MKRYISGLVKLGVGTALGLGIGYLVFKADVNNCKNAYQKEMAQIEEKYKGMSAVEELATPKDFSLDYVVSEKKGFKGFVFKDNVSGKQGVIAKASLLGNNRYFMEYAPLEGIVDNANAKVAVQPNTKIYAKKE